MRSTVEVMRLFESRTAIVVGVLAQTPLSLVLHVPGSASSRNPSMNVNGLAALAALHPLSFFLVRSMISSMFPLPHEILFISFLVLWP